MDVVVTGGPNDDTRFWRNDTNSGNGWLTVRPAGTRSNRSGIGARVEVSTNLGTTTKEVSGGAGRGSFNSLPVEMGLGVASEVCAVIVRWPAGGVSVRLGDATNGAVAVTEDDLLGAGFESGGLCGWRRVAP